MKKLLACALAALSLAACAGNRNEAEADKITRAVIANNMAPVMGDLDPAIKGQITRVRIAELSDELNEQGAYQGLKQDTTWCRTGYTCFDVQFAKRPYHEIMKVGSDGKVQYWWIHAAAPK
ncbi:MAG TPA: hypothetical protein VGZ02_08875 [Candidatus Baltobacteraceae bacterium]|jgi:hypothetical protein|nr:hypothetical protein [Candidatus Baltobacteraceae bacterium]